MTRQTNHLADLHAATHLVEQPHSNCLIGWNHEGELRRRSERIRIGRLKHNLAFQFECDFDFPAVFTTPVQTYLTQPEVVTARMW